MIIIKKYADAYERYKKEKEIESKRFGKIMKKVMNDDSILAENKSSAIMKAMEDYIDLETDLFSEEEEWIDEHKKELSLKKEWLNHNMFCDSRPNFKEFFVTLIRTAFIKISSNTIPLRCI